MSERPVRRLVFGLGNPGPEYEGTRHNVGFDVLDVMARRAGVFFEGSRILDGYSGPRALACAYLEDLQALLVKPFTWMNLSGDAVLPLALWAGGGEVRPEELMVVYDDLDLAVGDLRIRPKGGAGGQKGMRSIVESLATDAFPRLRVGIGKAPTDAARHVLSRFLPDEQVLIDIAAEQACDAIDFWLRTGDLEKCMTRFHSRWKQDSDVEPSAPSDEPARKSEKEIE